MKRGVKISLWCLAVLICLPVIWLFAVGAVMVISEEVNHADHRIEPVGYIRNDRFIVGHYSQTVRFFEVTGSEVLTVIDLRSKLRRPRWAVTVYPSSSARIANVKFIDSTHIQVDVDVHLEGLGSYTFDLTDETRHNLNF